MQKFAQGDCARPGPGLRRGGVPGVVALQQWLRMGLNAKRQQLRKRNSEVGQHGTELDHGLLLQEIIRDWTRTTIYDLIFSPIKWRASMFITYLECHMTWEGDPAEFVIGADYIDELCADDFDDMACNESLWFVPGTVSC